MKNVLIVLFLLLICGLVSGCYSYETNKELEQLETEFYKVQERILEMAETNDNTFKEIGSEEYDHYYFDEFSSELSSLEMYIQELTQDM